MVVAGLVVAALLFFMMGKKKDSTSTSAEPTTSTAQASLTTPQGTVDMSLSVTPSSGAAAATTAPTSGGVPTGTVSPNALAPGKGLPKDVVDSWKSGDTTVLLFVRPAGVDDKLVKGSVD